MTPMGKKIIVWILHAISLLHFNLFLINFREKKTSNDWFPSIPDNAKLKDADTDVFVQCLLPSLKMAMFSKFGTIDAASAYHNLALIRPEMVLPDLLNR